ncbi:MAG: DNA polymerase III subunit gamma/tau [Anaerolineae bacterium]|nr:DNA polymerase III subunit gamma/tau [Anaerolineae bacterium]
MPAQALYLKWRPMTLDDVVGQEHVTTTLRNALKQEKVRHAYLFSGPRGTGKTSVARLLAKAVNCLNPDPAQRPDNTCPHCVAVNEGRFLDLIEIDAASHTGVDDVRDLRDKIAFSPSQGRYKVYIIDEVHRFSGAAFDALLKTLEEPPAHALFVLATTEIDKVPATIKSRCQRFDFKRIPHGQIVARLAEMTDAEGLKVERRALELVARQSTGSLRDAISLMDQLVADPEAEITLAMAEDVLGVTGGEAAGEVVQAVLAMDTAAGLEAINRAISAGAEPRQLAREIVDWMRNVLLVSVGGPGMVDVSEKAAEALSRQAQSANRALLVRAIRAFNDAIQEAHGGWQPQLPLELALVSCTLRPEPADAAPATAPAPAAQKPSQAPEARPAAPAPPPPAPEVEAAPDEGDLADASGGGPATVTLAEVVARWDEIVQKTRRYSTIAGARLGNFQPVRVEGNRLVLSSNPFFRGKFDDAEYQDALLDALSAVFGVQMALSVVVSEDSETHDNPPARDETLNGDPLLKAAVEELGGTITSVEQKLINDDSLDARG